MINDIRPIFFLILISAIVVLPTVLVIAEELPAAGDIENFYSNPKPNLSNDFFADFEVTLNDINDILNSWCQVTEEHWTHNYSHVALADRTGSISLKDNRELDWMVKPGGLATIRFPNGNYIFLAKSCNENSLLDRAQAL